MFPYLSSRAVHIEITNSLERDSFTLALRRFSTRWGNVKSITSDSGTNFVGEDNELKKAFNEMNYKQIQHFLVNTGANWQSGQETLLQLAIWVGFRNAK